MRGRDSFAVIGRISASSGVPPRVVSGPYYPQPLLQGGRGPMPV